MAGFGRLALSVFVTLPAMFGFASGQDGVARSLAPTGRLRVGVYPGSPTSLVRVPGSEDISGVTVEIGREIGRRLGVPVDIVEEKRPAEVVEALKVGRVDLTVTNASPSRMKELTFTKTLFSIELGFLVPASSTAKTGDDIDQPGIRIGVTDGSTTLGVLPSRLKAATIRPAASLSAGTEMLQRGEIEAYATNKPSLYEMAEGLSGARVLDGRWGEEHLAVAVPKGRQAAQDFLEAFVEDARSSGFVSRAIKRSGVKGAVPAE